MKITRVNFNSFPLIKRTFSSGVDFTRVKDFKNVYSNWSYLNKLKSLKKVIGSVPSEDSVRFCWIYNRTYAWHSCAQRAELKHGNRTLPYILNRKTEPDCVNHSAADSHQELEQRKTYRQTVWQCCYSPKNHIWTVKTRISIVYLQLKFDEKQNDYFTQTLVFISRGWVKRNKFLLEKIELTHLI